VELALVPIPQAQLGLRGRNLLPDRFYKSLFLETSNFLFAFGLSAVGQGFLILPVPNAAGPQKERAACHGGGRG